MKDLLPLIFNDENVRTQYSEEHGVLFMNKDVCHVLEYANPWDVAANLDHDEKVTLANPEGQSGSPRVWLTESGVFTVIMRSNKPVAKAFRKVVLDYIKSISTTGHAIANVSSANMELLANDPVGEMILNSARMYAEHLGLVERTNELERQMASLGDLRNSYMSVIGWFNYNGGTVSNEDAPILGKICSKICRQRDIEIGHVKHERWGTVQTYPEAVIAEAYEKFKGRY